MSKRCLYFFMKWMIAVIPSSFGIFVSNGMTSAVTKDPLVRRNGSF